MAAHIEIRTATDIVTAGIAIAIATATAAAMPQGATDPDATAAVGTAQVETAQVETARRETAPGVTGKPATPIGIPAVIDRGAMVRAAMVRAAMVRGAMVRGAMARGVTTRAAKVAMSRALVAQKRPRRASGREAYRGWRANAATRPFAGMRRGATRPDPTRFRAGINHEMPTGRFDRQVSAASGDAAAAAAVEVVATAATAPLIPMARARVPRATSPSAIPGDPTSRRAPSQPCAQTQPCAQRQRQVPRRYRWKRWGPQDQRRRRSRLPPQTRARQLPP